MNISDIDINTLLQYVATQGYAYEEGDGSRKHQLKMCGRFADGVTCLHHRIAGVYSHLCEDDAFELFFEARALYAANFTTALPAKFVFDI